MTLVIFLTTSKSANTRVFTSSLPSPALPLSSPLKDVPLPAQFTGLTLVTLQEEVPSPVDALCVPSPRPQGDFSSYGCPSIIGLLLVFTLASLNICQDGDHWKANFLQLTVLGAQEPLPVPGIKVKWVDDQIWEANYIFHPQVTTLPTP